MLAKMAINTYCIINTTLPIALNRSLSLRFSLILLVNPRIMYCPKAKIKPKMAKIVILDCVERNPPVIAEILTIDVSTTRVITKNMIRMKMPLEPILIRKLFKTYNCCRYADIPY